MVVLVLLIGLINSSMEVTCNMNVFEIIVCVIFVIVGFFAMYHSIE